MDLKLRREIWVGERYGKHQYVLGGILGNCRFSYGQKWLNIGKIVYDPA